jgi:antitoxin (DNA-binding transcriptional repressor) of toxin-antitoxin stability system
MKATILDLRYRTRDVLKAVERGQTVSVLYRGREKALLTPLPQSIERKASADPAFGVWKNRGDMRDVSTVVRELRQGRYRDL